MSGATDKRKQRLVQRVPAFGPMIGKMPPPSEAGVIGMLPESVRGERVRRVGEVVKNRRKG